MSTEFRLPDATPAAAPANAPVIARPGTRRYAVLIPLALAILAHLPGLWSGLVWDDQRVADQAVFFEHPGDVFLPPAAIPGWSDAYYRPVVILTDLLDFGLLNGREVPLVPHLSNILFHGVTTFFVWLLARRCWAGRAAVDLLALAAAAVFAVHPIHTESVNWVSGRSDVLATMLLLPGVLLALRWRDSGSWPALAGGAALVFLALLAKEIAIAALVIVPAAWWLVPAGCPTGVGQPGPAAPTGRAFWATGMSALLVAAAAYLLLRQAAGTTQGVMLDIGPLVAAIGLSRALAYYLVKLIVPWPQSNLVVWEMLPAWTDAAVILLAAGILAAWAVRRWRRRAEGIALLAITWVLAGVAPSLWIALVHTATGPVAERYLYLPSVGMALGSGWLLAAVVSAESPAWGRRAAVAAVALAVAAYLGMALQRGTVWIDNVHLWSDATVKMPGRAFQWASLARAWRAEGKYEPAFQAYRQGLASEPDARARAKLIYGIAELHLERGELAQAQTEFDRSRLEDPSFLRPLLGLGLVEMTRARLAAGLPGAEGHRQRASRHFEAVLAGDPALIESRLALAQLAADHARVLAQSGQSAAARERYRAALERTDEVLARLPSHQLEAYLRVAETSLEKNVVAFRARLEADLQHLGADSSPGN